jgi:hypothetical protein
MYKSYADFVASISKDNIEHVNFKSNSNYNAILEHVMVDEGNKYIKYIKQFFPKITYNNILEFVSINDKYGVPKKETFTFSDGQTLFCSPTSLRYVFHSMIILRYYEYKKSCKNMIEVGCGYGGLFLAICYFSKLFNIKIDHYCFIDLPQVGGLIKSYLEMHKRSINIKYSIHSAYNYGSDIDKNNLFLISNYCFTEISDEHRNKYIETLFPKISNGFIIWQTIFNCSIEETNKINKNIEKVVEEIPQTASKEKKNYFVYF